MSSTRAGDWSGALVLVTGATGLLGGHLAERLSARGARVRALVRPTSDLGRLEGLGVSEAVSARLESRGDRGLAEALEGVDFVFHAAAKVGDWGSWGEFRAGCVEATRNLAEAAAERGVSRFVHFSSTSWYGHPRAGAGSEPLGEEAPAGRGIWVLDHYTRAKIESELAAREVAERRGLELTVIRPGWLYGERDRVTAPRLARRMREGVFRLVGRGDNPLSAVHAGAVADAAILAARHPEARGEAFNVSDQGRVTQREFFGMFARALGLSPPTASVPYALAYGLGFQLELLGKAARWSNPPLVTRYAAWLMGRELSYSTRKIRERLGWNHPEPYEATIGRTADWLRASGAF